MNYGNDFSSSLAGWQGVVGTAPGTLVPATNVVSLAPPVVKTAVAAGFVLTPSGVSGKNGTVDTIFAPEVLQRGVPISVVARFGSTVYIGAKIDAALMCYLVEYHTGAEHVLASVDLSPMLPPGTTAPVNMRLAFYGTRIAAFVKGLQVLEATCTIVNEGLAGFGFSNSTVGMEVADQTSGMLDALDNSGTTTMDCEYEALGLLGFTGTRTDRELAWLRSHGAVSKALPDAWMEFLDVQAAPPGALPDRQWAWLMAVLGEPTARTTLIDLWHTFWCDLGGVIDGGAVKVSADPFFTTPFSRPPNYENIWSASAIVEHPADGHVRLPANANIWHHCPWYTPGDFVTFYLRLKEPYAGTPVPTSVEVAVVEFNPDTGAPSWKANTPGFSVVSGSAYAKFRAQLPSFTGDMGFYLGSYANWSTFLEIESFAFNVLEADGGPVQFVDPYITAWGDGITGWGKGDLAEIQTVGAGALFPAGMPAFVWAKPAWFAPGVTVEWRVFIRDCSPNSCTLRYDTGGAGFEIPLVKGWNSGTFICDAATRIFVYSYNTLALIDGYLDFFLLVKG